MDLQPKLMLTQAVGFLIVLWVLRKYAWGKLIAFIDERREQIASSFEEIDRGKEEVARLQEQYQKELDQIEVTKRAKLQEAAREANELAAQIKEEARREALAVREKTQDDIQLELDKANVALRDRMVDAVITATEKLIHERLDADKHRELIVRFLETASVKAE